MNIPVEISRPVFRAALILQKNSPNILFSAGIVGAVASTVMACKATLKLAEQLPEMKKELECIRTEVVDEKERGRALALCYTVNASKIAKTYAPSVIVGGLSIASLTGSHITLNHRNATLTAGYAAINKMYEDYRERVRQEFGVEKELDIHRGLTTETLTTEDGKKTEIKISNDPNKHSIYAKWFGPDSPNYEKDPELNLIFLKAQQEQANWLLQSRGHIFLQEVYDMLGLERNNQAQIVGWVISKDGSTDNFVDFGLYQGVNRSFINGIEPAILLDFNVDGVILDMIGKRK